MYQHYQTGRDWKRQAVVKTAGFAAGLYFASMAITVATPFGLVLAIATAGAIALGTDFIAKEIAGIGYDLL